MKMRLSIFSLAIFSFSILFLSSNICFGMKRVKKVISEESDEGFDLCTPGMCCHPQLGCAAKAFGSCCMVTPCGACCYCFPVGVCYIPYFCYLCLLCSSCDSDEEGDLEDGVFYLGCDGIDCSCLKVPTKLLSKVILGARDMIKKGCITVCDLDRDEDDSCGIITKESFDKCCCFLPVSVLACLNFCFGDCFGKNEDVADQRYVIRESVKRAENRDNQRYRGNRSRDQFKRESNFSHEFRTNDFETKSNTLKTTRNDRVRYNASNHENTNSGVVDANDGETASQTGFGFDLSNFSSYLNVDALTNNEYVNDFVNGFKEKKNEAMEGLKNFFWGVDRKDKEDQV